MNKSRRNALSFAFYIPLAVLGYFASTPEETRDFGRVAKEFRVMAMRDGKPVSATLATLPQSGAGITYLLPGRVVEIPGGDLHKATVLESSPQRQLVRYDFGNTVDSTSVYQAFRDRVQPVSHKLNFHPGIVFVLIVLLLPAWLLAFIVDWLWGRLRSRQAKSDLVP